VVSGGLTYYLNNTHIQRRGDTEHVRGDTEHVKGDTEHVRGDTGHVRGVSGNTAPDRHGHQVKDEQEKQEMPDLAIHISGTETRNETSENTVMGSIYDWGKWT